MPSCRGSSQPRDQAQVSSRLQADSLPTELLGKPRSLCGYPLNTEVLPVKSCLLTVGLLLASHLVQIQEVFG